MVLILEEDTIHCRYTDEDDDDDEDEDDYMQEPSSRSAIENPGSWHRTYGIGFTESTFKINNITSIVFTEST